MTTRFGFLLFDDFEDLDFAGPWEMIAVWSKQFNGPHELCLISEQGHDVTSAKGLTLKTHYSLATCPQLDYLLIPGGQGTRREVNNQKLLAFIQTQANDCQHILSVCTGSFLLQAAGVLQHKKATTHWASMDRLRVFTDVTVVEERFTRDGNIWTSAGVSAGIDMALAFIAALAGEHTAGDVQLFAEYYPQPGIYPINAGHYPNYVKRET